MWKEVHIIAVYMSLYTVVVCSQLLRLAAERAGHAYDLYLSYLSVNATSMHNSVIER